jgi:uncharacterized protein (TIGR03083 family)
MSDDSGSAPGPDATSLDVEALVDEERSRLADLLEDLDGTRWATPSLCTGWSVRHVVAHLLMPYRLSVPRFMVKMAAGRFDFDRVADRWATRYPGSNEELVGALRRTASQRFNVPGAPPAAPLSHLVIHQEDIRRPLGVRHRTDPRSANSTLDQLTSPHARGSLNRGLLDGLAYVSSDTGWRFGDGDEVIGSASALITTITGRHAALDELSGAGADHLRARLLAG